MSARAIGLAVVLPAAAASLLTWALTPEPADSPTEVAEPTPVLSCTFSEGERLAYDLSSRVGAGDIEDRFSATLGLEVVEVTPEGTLARAALSELTLDQALTEPHERTSARAIEGEPFFLRIDGQCRFSEIGFMPSWETPARRLVTTVLRANEIVVPGEPTLQWEAAQVDGGGDYVAHYTAAANGDEVRVVRHKPRYEVDPQAQALGITVAVLRSEAVAHFASSGIRSVRGAEQVLLSLPDGSEQILTHRFSMERSDTTPEVARAPVGGADFRDALSMASAPAPDAFDPGLAEMELAEARDTFAGTLANLGLDAVFPAARFLADWLKANPQRSGELFESLRQGELPDATHASFFLAFELAGTDASREVLFHAIQDDVLTDLNRARAASALADHGEPSQAVADALLGLANDESETVATVSRLGLGSLAGRADGALGESLRDTLRGELDGARTRADRVAVIDAIGNTADDRFAPVLVEHLGASEPSVRAHAAEAMGRLSPEVARDQLVAQLEAEEDPRVATSLLRGLHQLGGSAISESELALATAQLSSPDPDVRRGLIEWLGQSASDPQVRQLLASHFHVESDIRLKQRLGAFVSAADLRSAG